MGSTVISGKTVTRPRVALRQGRLVRLDVPNQQATASASAEPTPTEADAAPAKAGTFGKVCLVLFVITLFGPNFFPVGPLRMTFNLTYLLIGFIPLFIMWMMGRPSRPNLPDLLVLAFIVWASVVRIIQLGLIPALEPVGLNLLQTLSGYLFGRILVRDAATTRIAFGSAIICMMIIVFPLMMESATGNKVLLNAAQVFGPVLPSVDMEPRWGFKRAQGVFEHPILLGVFAASLVSYSVYLFRNNRFMRFAGPPAVVISAMTSLSTGALLTMNIQFGLMLWGFVFRNVRKHWTILITILAVLYVIVDMVSNRTPFHLFVDYATFNSGSSYNRILIWQFGTQNVMNSPFLGHSSDDWERPAYMSTSMDNFWLALAYRYGIPAVVFLVGATILTLLRMSKLHGPTQEIDAMRRAAIFAMVGTMVAIVSVHLWNSCYVWYMFMLGAINWMSQPGSGSTEPLDYATQAEGNAKSIDRRSMTGSARAIRT